MKKFMLDFMAFIALIVLGPKKEDWTRFRGY